MATEKKVLVSVDTNEAKKGLTEFISKLKELFNNILGVTDTAKKELKDVDSAAKSTGSSLQKALDKKGLTDYVDKMKDLGKGFLDGNVSAKELSKGVLDVGKSLLKVFITNPILLAVTAIIAAIGALVNIFKTFAPVVDKVEQAFAGLSAAFNVLKSGIANFLSGNKSLKESFDGLGTSMKNAAIEGARLKKVEQDLEDSARSLVVANAEAARDYEKLIIQAKNRTLSEKERIALYEQAEKIRRDNFEKNYKQAKDEEELQKGLLAQLDENTTTYEEQQEKLNAATVKRINLEREQANFEEGVQNRKEQLAQQQEAARKKREEDRAAAEKKRIDDLVKSILDEGAAKRAAAEQDKAIQDEMDQMAEDFQKKQDEEWQREQERNKQKQAADIAASQAAIDAVNAETEAIKKAEQEKQDARARAVEAAQTGLNMLSSLEKSLTEVSMGLLKRKYEEGKITQEEFDRKSAELQKKAAKRQKAFAISQAIIDTAGAIIGFLGAKPVGPWNWVQAALAGVLGAAQVAAIVATPIDGGSAGSTTPKSSIGGGGEGTSPNTSFSFAPRAAETPQLQPAKAYVISKDIRTQTQLDRQAVANGTI